MNYEMLIERARYTAKGTFCLVKPRMLNQMADALENQERVIEGLREIIEKQGGAALRGADLALELDTVKAELVDERDRFDRLSDFGVAEAQELAKAKRDLAVCELQLHLAADERNIAQKRVIELEQELAQLKKEQTSPALDAGRNAPKTSIPQEVADV